MKIAIYLPLLVHIILYPINVEGQVSVTHVTNKQNTESVIENQILYDSLENFVGKKVFDYVGQEFYLKGIRKDMRDFEYRNFYTTNINELLSEDDYMVNIYKRDENYVSSYNELVGKYFEVLEIQKHPEVEGLKKTKEALRLMKIIRGGKDTPDDKKVQNILDKQIRSIKENFFVDGKCFIKLLEKESNDIVYYQYSTTYKHSFPFLVVGYFEKLKQLFVGKDFVFDDYRINGSVDIISGKAITNRTGQLWKCIDVTIEDEFFNETLIIQDSIGQKTTTKIEGIVFIGMTKDMCRVSNGKPKTISISKVPGKIIERWVYYSDIYLFENEILTSIYKQKPKAPSKK